MSLCVQVGLCTASAKPPEKDVTPRTRGVFVLDFVQCSTRPERSSEQRRQGLRDWTFLSTKAFGCSRVGSRSTRRTGRVTGHRAAQRDWFKNLKSLNLFIESLFMYTL